jgi:hypothetical protein
MSEHALTKGDIPRYLIPFLGEPQSNSLEWGRRRRPALDLDPSFRMRKSIIETRRARHVVGTVPMQDLFPTP